MSCHIENIFIYLNKLWLAVLQPSVKSLLKQIHYSRSDDINSLNCKTIANAVSSLWWSCPPGGTALPFGLPQTPKEIIKKVQKHLRKGSAVGHGFQSAPSSLEVMFNDRKADYRCTVHGF